MMNIIRLFVLGSALWAGIQTQNVWVGLLVFFGMLGFNKGFSQKYLLNPNDQNNYLFQASSGSILIAIATSIGGLRFGWLWMFIWLEVALAWFISSFTMYRTAPRWRFYLGFFASTLAIVFSLLCPFLQDEMWRNPSFFLWSMIWIILLGGGFLFLNIKAKNYRHKDILLTALLLDMAISTVIGLATHNLWVGGAVFVGLFLLYKDQHRIIEGAILQYRRYMIQLYTGVFLIAIAAWLDRLQAGWVWTPIWLITMVSFLLLGSFLYKPENERRYHPRGMSWSSTAALITAGLVGLFALLGPLLGPLSQLDLDISSFRTVAIFVLLGAGLWMTFLAANSGRKIRYYLRHSLMGFFFLVLATYFGGRFVPWGWSILWVLVAFLFGLGSNYLPRKRSVSIATGFLVILSLLLAAIVPSIGQNWLSGNSPPSLNEIEWLALLKSIGIVIGAFALLVALVVFLFIQVKYSEPHCQDHKLTKLRWINESGD
jgi:hypothetical protein